MKGKNGVGGDVKISAAVFAFPPLTSSKKIGVVADATMRTDDVGQVIGIAPTLR
jgi:hypothetical protein